MTTIKFDCPHCKNPLEVEQAGAGMAVLCPRCSKRVVIPNDSKSELPSVAKRQSAERQSSPSAVMADNSMKKTNNLLLALCILIFVSICLSLVSLNIYNKQASIISGQVNKLLYLTDKRKTAPEYEFKVITPYDGSIESELNMEGRDGWTVLSARRATSDYGSPKYELIMGRQTK